MTKHEEPLSLAEAVLPPKRQTTARQIVVAFRRHPVSIVGLVYLVVLVLVAIFANQVAPHDPNAVDPIHQFQRMFTPGHVLGTDRYGRDQLSRLIFGARTSLLGGAEAVAVATSLGAPLGLVAGYFGSRIDGALSRVNDALTSVPALMMALAIVAVIGPGLGNAMLAVGIVIAPRVFRVVRAAAIEVRETTFVEASIALGCRSRRVLFAHVLPNVTSPLLVVVSTAFAFALLAESALSYLGLGVKAPTASWGVMLSDAASRLDLEYLIYPPGVVLALSVLAWTLVSDTFREAIVARRRFTDV